jgi:hypothetical protein
MCRGQPQGSPGKHPFLRKIIKSQTNSQIVNYTSRNHGLVTGGAHDPGNLSGPSSGRPRHPSGETPPRSRGPASYHRNSASLEGWTLPRAKLRLARSRPELAAHQVSNLGIPRAELRLDRGLYAPLGGSPPRSRAAHPRADLRFARGSRGSAAPGTHSPDRRIKCSNTTRALRSRTNPRHAGPLTPPGNRIPALFRQLSP